MEREIDRREAKRKRERGGEREREREGERVRERDRKRNEMARTLECGKLEYYSGRL